MAKTRKSSIETKTQEKMKKLEEEFKQQYPVRFARLLYDFYRLRGPRFCLQLCVDDELGIVYNFVIFDNTGAIKFDFGFHPTGKLSKNYYAGEYFDFMEDFQQAELEIIHFDEEFKQELQRQIKRSVALKKLTDEDIELLGIKK